jgi:hypothetical protein
MLNDFLVLGQIPGTKIQITFKELLFGLTVYLLARIVIKILSIQKIHRTSLNFRAIEDQQLSLL